MRKSLVTLLVSLALCGAGTAAVIAATVQAEAPRKPVLVAMVASTPPHHDDAAPPDAGGGRSPGGRGPRADQIAAMRSRMCNDRYARAAGQIAYLEARLSLTPAQTGAFTAWKDIRLGAAKHRAETCAAQTGPRARDAENRDANRDATPPNPADRMAREETRLKARLADLEAERPALQSLYTALTPAQRRLFAQRGGEGMRGGMRQRFAMAGPMGMRGGARGMDMGPRGMGMGPMGRRGGPGGDAGQAPPPPPQP